MSRSSRLLILSTHPIQYHTPWFRALASEPQIELQVLFCHNPSSREHSDSGFGVEFDWDVPLLKGYPHTFLPNVARTPTLHTFSGLDTPEVQQIIASRSYDAVLVNGWHYKSAWQAIGACWRTHTPVMVRGDSHLRTRRAWLKRSLKHLLYRQFIPRFDACLAVGAWSREYFLQYGAAPNRVLIVPHVIDVKHFVQRARELYPHRSALRARWGINATRCVFLFVGKFVQKKRPLDFVRAVAQASSSDARIAGLMVGDGPLRAECEALAQQLQAPICFTGFLNQSEIVSAYAVSDVLVLPSDGAETWGLVVNEALACGCRVLVSDQVGCGPDLVGAGEVGAIFPMGNVDHLARLLVDWSDRTCADSAPGALSAVLAKFEPARAVEGTLAALERIA